MLPYKVCTACSVVWAEHFFTLLSLKVNTCLFNPLLFIKNKLTLYPQRVSLPFKKSRDVLSQGTAAIKLGVTALYRY
jgi:hypothetical protein